MKLGGVDLMPLTGPIMFLSSFIDNYRRIDGESTTCPVIGKNKLITPKGRVVDKIKGNFRRYIFSPDMSTCQGCMSCVCDILFTPCYRCGYKTVCQAENKKAKRGKALSKNRRREKRTSH
jgi:hypothetical protein